MMRKFLLISGGLLILVLLVVVIGAVSIYQAARHEPEFYQQALKAEPKKQAEAGDEFERQVFELRNEVRREGDWQAVFTDEQINGWLAVDLPEKFPSALPNEVQQPRVSIEPGQAMIAARVESKQIAAVVSLAVDVHLTEEPNVVAVRIRAARAGMLPIPLSDWLDQASEASQRADIPVRWTQQDGDPVALVTLPSEHEEFKDRILMLETIELRNGEVFLSGRSQPREGLSATATARLEGALK